MTAPDVLPNWSRAIVPMKVLWFLIYFISTEGFGLRSNDWGGLGTSNLGWYGVMQVLVAVISVVAVIPGLKCLYGARNQEPGVAKAVLVLTLAPAYMALVTLVRAVEGVGSLGDISANLFQLKFFLMIYLFAYLLSKPNGVEDALNTMAVYSLITAVAIVIVIVLGLDTAVSSVKTSTDVTRFFRVIFPGAVLVAAGWLLFFCRYLFFGRLADLLCALVCLGASVMQLHRTVLIAISISLVVLLLAFFGAGSALSPTRKRMTLGFFGAVIFYAAYSGVFSSQLVIEYFTRSRDEILFGSADFGHRILLIVNNLDYVISRTWGLGVGFHWEHVEDIATYLLTGFVAGPTFDSSFANIIIVLGLPGVALFVWLYYRLGVLSKMLRGFDDPYRRMYGLFLLAFLVYSLLLGVGADIVMLTSSAEVYVLILASAVFIQKPLPEETA